MREKFVNGTQQLLLQEVFDRKIITYITTVLVNAENILTRCRKINKDTCFTGSVGKGLFYHDVFPSFQGSFGIRKMRFVRSSDDYKFYFRI